MTIFLFVDYYTYLFSRNKNQIVKSLKEINKINESNLAKLSDSERYSSILN
jgi:hypothetical protein